MTEPVSALSDRRALRDAFGCFMTGVTVVTTLDTEGRPRGFTANSFSSVSLDPPLLLVSIARTSASIDSFTEGAGFAVNILAEGQEPISSTFARPVDDRFAGLDWRRGPVGSPLIADVSAWFDCARDQTVPAGDHIILIGRVGAFESTALPGLGYYRGAYMRPSQTTGQLPTGPEVVISAIIEAEGRVLLVEDRQGGLTVPTARVGLDGVQATLAALIDGLGVEAGPGSIYAIYEDTRQGRQHMALRCPARSSRPARGSFVDVAHDGVARIGDAALRAMLERLAEESRIGNFGIYFGTQDTGRVHRVSGEA